MKLERFQGTAINGYLNFDVSFLEGLTFLTGINGTGKTSALNAIASLLMPRLDYLATQQFDSISVLIEESGEPVRLWAEKLEDVTVLRCSKFPDTEIEFETYYDTSEFGIYKSKELENEHYKKLLDLHAKNEIMQYILDLPTPMFLGLDRRSRSLDSDNTIPRRFSNRQRTVRKNNIFGTTLVGSLSEALYFAENTILDCIRRKSSLDKKFRDTLIFELLNFPLTEFTGFREDDVYFSEDQLAITKENVYRIPKLLDLDNDAITVRLNEIFKFIEDNIEAASEFSEDDDFEDTWESPAFRARLALSENRSSLAKINTLSELVKEYTEEISQIYQIVHNFVDKVNSFILDSEKTLQFDDRGILSFSVGDETNQRDLRTLSSGEIQLIVIFAHLYFNPETKKANVFIIDEPELSLHVQWQAKFVDAILSSSERTQFIMATHSPTVIMHRVGQCVEINSK